MSVPRRLQMVPWNLRYRALAKAGSEARRLAVRATHGHCTVEFRGPVRIGPGFALDIPDHGTLIVGSGVDLRRGFVCEISGHGRVTIGDGCVFTAGAMIQCTTSIEFGEGCVIGQSAMFVDGRHRFGDPTRPSMDQGYDYRPLRIGAHAMVMSKCTVFSDVGEGAFVGAHSVVSRPVPAHCLAVGAPARPVRSFNPDDSGDRPAPDPDVVAALLGTESGPGLARVGGW